MKILFAILTLALVSLTPSSAVATPIKVGEHYNFLETSYVEYSHDYTLLSTEWQWWGYLVYIEHWQAYLYSHAWGVRQLVWEMWDDETLETWEEPQTPENYDFEDDTLYFFDLVYGDGGGGEQAIAQSCPQ